MQRARNVVNERYGLLTTVTLFNGWKSTYHFLFRSCGAHAPLGDAFVAKTQFVNYANRGFWAYDVALGVFLKHLIDAAEASGQADTTWLSSAVGSWRTVACISDYGLTLDSNWSAAQRQT